MRALPRFLQLEPVGECNLRCQMCPIQFRGDGRPHGPPAFMDFELYCRLLDEFPDLEELHLQGLGEPLMHPRFFDMVERAAARGIRVSTNTNLTLLTEKRAERCVRSGLHTLHASLDSADAEIYEEIRPRANFTKVARNLAHLVEARKKLGSTQPAIRLIVVIMRRNLESLTELVEFAAAHEIDNIFVQHLCHDFGEQSLPERYAPMREFIDAQTLLNADEARALDVFNRAQQRAVQLGIELRVPQIRPTAHPPGTPGPERCDWPWRGAYISYRGDAMPCCMVATPDRINFGNVAESNAFSVWNNAGYEAFRSALESEIPPDVCQSCAIYARTF